MIYLMLSISLFPTEVNLLPRRPFILGGCMTNRLIDEWINICDSRDNALFLSNVNKSDNLTSRAQRQVSTPTLKFLITKKVTDFKIVFPEGLAHFCRFSLLIYIRNQHSIMFLLTRCDFKSRLITSANLSHLRFPIFSQKSCFSNRLLSTVPSRNSRLLSKSDTNHVCRGN